MPDDSDTPTHDVTHRAFLQAFIARQAVTFEQGQAILADILTVRDPSRPTRPGDITRGDFERYVEQMNEAISPFDFEIRSTKHQKRNTEVWAFVNTTSDALTQVSTIHTADEIAFVRRVLDAMFETYNTIRAEIMAITAMQLTKLAKVPQEESRRDNSAARAQAASLTGTQAEQVMDSMVREGWFELSARGFYTLTPRALMELREWLHDTYNGDEDEEGEEDEEEHVKIKKCQACKTIITIGQRCPRLECHGRLHDRCVEPMFRAQNNQQVCPLCATPWTDPLPVGEKAAARRQSNGVTQRTSNGASQRSSNGTSQRRQSNMNLDGADGEDDESE